MPSPNELTSVVRIVAPDLKDVGFKRFGTTFNREPEAGLIHVVGFQGSKRGDRFTVNLGIYVREIDELFDDWGRREGKKGDPGRDGAVEEYVCWLRERIGGFDPSHQDRWWPYRNIDQAASDVRSKLRTRVEPVFSRLSKRSGLIELWDKTAGNDLGWSIEGRTTLGFALLLKHAGRADDAGQIVQRVCADSRGHPFHSMVQVLAEDLGFECTDDV